MESFDLTQLKKGEELLVTTESGSIYHLFAETAPESLGRGKHLIRGLRATRDSDHPISGDPELIENEPAVVQPFSSGGPGILEAGHGMQILWDRDHPESRNWDMQFGPVFQPLTTARIVGIELIPVKE